MFPTRFWILSGQLQSSPWRASFNSILPKSYNNKCCGNAAAAAMTDFLSKSQAHYPLEEGGLVAEAAARLQAPVEVVQEATVAQISRRHTCHEFHETTYEHNSQSQFNKEISCKQQQQ